MANRRQAKTSQSRSGSSERRNSSYREKEYREDRYRKANTGQRVFTGSNLLLALVGFLFIFSFSVVLTLNLRQIYYFDIKYQQLTYATGLSEEVIRNNYDTLIDYNLIPKQVHELEFPDFPMSEHGRIHFAEVKRIFVILQFLCVITGIGLVGGLLKKGRERDFGSLKLMSILTLVVPIILGILAAINWNVFFVKFHNLFFTNNYWIFNPATDPVINILPDAFFFHCVIAILALMLIGCLISAVLYRFLNRR